ncbi:signal peptidase II [Amycolatopsis sp. NPDC005961]|uniref:signal peptidase II n=1 Tax=Amycolatopsis sp. NPDC005961 TaxID=3156720 RepID=UPI0034091D02
MSSDGTAGTTRLEAAVPGARVSRPPWTAFALILVVVVDQVTKAWAWREVPRAHINFGGNPLVGPVVGAWYAGPVTGAVLDLAGSALLTAAVLLLLRRRHPAFLRAPAALAIGGWISNLLDRLGLHHLTAPGSVRGAIDFVPVGRYTFNVADFFIIGATLAFSLAHGYRWATANLSHTSADIPRPRPRLRTPARIVTASGAAVLVAAVTLGATHYGGTTHPPRVHRTSVSR